MNRKQVWENLRLPDDASLSEHDLVIKRRAQNELNHAMDLIEDALKRLAKMDCAGNRVTESDIIRAIQQ